MINPIQNKSIFFQSLGCPKNLVDAEVMLGITKNSGYALIEDPANADIIVLNTCSFIEASKRESIQTIIELAEYKESEKGKCEKLIVTGCLPQRYKPDLMAAFPEVDAFVGTGQYGNILEFIETQKKDEAEGFRHPKFIHNENTPRINSQPFYRAYLKISEGCIKGCAFCIIPRIRGTLRSRTIESLVKEAQQLVATGAKELNLIAQDLTDYGKDLKDGTNLYNLLKALVKVEGLEWVRLLYLYPDEMSDELIDLIATEPKICKYIDSPFQHINNRMLKVMNRHVTGEQIRGRVQKLRERIPNVFIRSSVIVGYPSETAEEFEELKAFVKEAKLDHLGVFSYSHEENTASYFMKDQLPEDVKTARRDELMLLQQEISKQNCQKNVGRIVNALVEEVSEESEFLWQARHQGQAPDIDGHILIRAGSFEKGSIVPVLLEEAMEYDYIGKIATAESAVEEQIA